MYLCIGLLHDSPRVERWEIKEKIFKETFPCGASRLDVCFNCIAKYSIYYGFRQNSEGL